MHSYTAIATNEDITIVGPIAGGLGPLATIPRPARGDGLTALTRAVERSGYKLASKWEACPTTDADFVATVEPIR